VLTIEAPLSAHGVTIFRDHQDPDQFYFLPGLPALTSFTLYKYRVAVASDGSDATKAPGAGMALFEVEIPQPKLAPLVDEIKQTTGRENPRLTQVLFSSADVHAVLPRQGDNDQLFPDLAETHAAPLTTPHHTAFGLALTAAGATFMQRAATAPPPPDDDGTGTPAPAPETAIPVGVVYELRFLALTPALHARVTMNYEQIYSKFSASVSLQYYYVKAALDLDLAWLVEHDYVKIDITQFTDDDDAKRQRDLVMQLVTARIQNDFFKSGLPAEQDSAQPSGPLASLLGGLVGGSGKNINSSSAMFVLKAKYEMTNQQKDFTLVYDSRTAVELTHTASAHLSTLAQGKSPKILEIDTSDPFFAKLNVKVLSVLDFDSLADVLDGTVNVTFHDKQPASYLLSRAGSGPFTYEVALPSPTDDQYTYDVKYDFDLDHGQGPARLEAGPFPSRSRALVVNPLLHFRYRQVRFVLGPVDPAMVPRIHMRVRVPGQERGAPDFAREEFVLSAAQPEHVFRVHGPIAGDPFRVRARANWEDAHGTIHDGDESEVAANALLVLGPYVETVPLYVSPSAEWAALTQIVIEVLYQDGDYVLDKTLTFPAAAKGAAQRLAIPLLDATKRRYKWRMTVFKNDGTSTQTDWAEADGTVLAPSTIVKTTADVRVVWVGSPGDAFGLRVDVFAENPSGDESLVSTFLRAGVDGDKVVQLPFDRDGHLAYRFTATKIGPSGETVVRSATGQTTTLIVVQT
jgi:hypothetical protein